MNLNIKIGDKMARRKSVTGKKKTFLAKAIKDKKEVSENSEDLSVPEKKTFLKGFKNRLKDKFFPSKTLLIEMMHTNGTVSHFIIKSDIYKFKLGERVYLIDEEKKDFNNTTKLYMLRYHEGFALPYKIDISASQFKRSLENKEFDEIKTSFNPFVLRQVLKMEYTNGIIQGAEIMNILKRLFIIIVIVGIISIAHLLIHSYKAGWI